MSLNFNISKIKNSREVTTTYDENDREIWSPVTQAIVFKTMAIGINEITEDNVLECFARSVLTDKLHGHMLQDENGGLEITVEQWEAHVGLTTNASALTEDAFLTNMARQNEETLTYARRRGAHERQDAAV